MFVVGPALFGFALFIAKLNSNLPPYPWMLPLMGYLEIALWPFLVPISAVDAPNHLPIRSPPATLSISGALIFFSCDGFLLVLR